jgi:hypothetical protein
MQRASQRPPQTMFRYNVPVPCSDFSSSYHAPNQFAHQSLQHAPNTHHRSPNLPSLLHTRSDRPDGGLDNGVGMPSPCTDNHGYNYGTVYEPEHSNYSSRRAPMYDQVHRNHPSYNDSHGNGNVFPSAQARHLPTYDASKGYAPLPAGYVDGEYSPHSPHPLSSSPYSHFGILGDSGDSRSKKRRGNLPKPVTDILRAWFHEHLDHPYPSEDDKQMLIARTGLTISQVCTTMNLGKLSRGSFANRSVTGSSTQGVANCLLYGTNIEARTTTREVVNMPRKTTTVRRRDRVLPDRDGLTLQARPVQRGSDFIPNKELTQDLS